MRDHNVLSNDLTSGIEYMRAFNLLWKRFVLLKRLTSQSLIISKNLRSIEIVLHVRNLSRKSCSLTNSSSLWGVRHYVFRRNHDLVVIFWVSEILCNMLKVFHMLVGSVSWLSNVLCWSKSLIIANFNLSHAILSPNQSACCLLKWISNANVGRFGKETSICASLLHGTSFYISGINLDLLSISVGYQSCYFHPKKKRVTSFVKNFSYFIDNELIWYLRFFCS